MHRQQHRAVPFGAHAVRHVGVNEEQTSRAQLMRMLAQGNGELAFQNVNRNPAVRAVTRHLAARPKREQNLRNRAMMQKRDLPVSARTSMGFGAQFLQFGVEIKGVMLARETLLRRRAEARRGVGRSGVCYIFVHNTWLPMNGCPDENRNLKSVRGAAKEARY